MKSNYNYDGLMTIGSLAIILFLIILGCEFIPQAW